MKKIISIILAGALIFGLAGCGVLQEDYDAVTSESKGLKSDIDSLKSELSQLQTEYDSLKKLNRTITYYTDANSSGKFDYSSSTASFNYDESLTTLMELNDPPGAALLYPSSLSANLTDDEFLTENTQMTIATMQIDPAVALFIMSGGEESLTELATGLFKVAKDDIIDVEISAGELFKGPVIYKCKLADGREGYFKALSNDSGNLSMAVAVLNDDVPIEEAEAISLAFDSVK